MRHERLCIFIWCLIGVLLLLFYTRRLSLNLTGLLLLLLLSHFFQKQSPFRMAENGQCQKLSALQ